MLTSGQDGGQSQRRFSGDGENPTKEWKRWKRWSKAFLAVQKAKGMPAEAFGPLLFTLLDGTAVRSFDQVGLEKLETAGGQDIIYEVLDNRFPEEEAHDRIGEVLDCIFGLEVKKQESTSVFTGRVRSAFATAEAEGINSPSVARGYLLLRFAKIAPERKAVVLAAARQSYEEKDIAASLRTTYPEGLGATRREHVHAVEASEAQDDGG